MSLEPTLFQTESRLRELRAEAALAALAALATCCQPSWWRQRWVAGVTAVRHRSSTAACCA